MGLDIQANAHYENIKNEGKIEGNPVIKKGSFGKKTCIITVKDKEKGVEREYQISNRSLFKAKSDAQLITATKIVIFKRDKKEGDSGGHYEIIQHKGEWSAGVKSDKEARRPLLPRVINAVSSFFKSLFRSAETEATPPRYVPPSNEEKVPPHKNVPIAKRVPLYNTPALREKIEKEKLIHKDKDGVPVDFNKAYGMVKAQVDETGAFGDFAYQRGQFHPATGALMSVIDVNLQVEQVQGVANLKKVTEKDKICITSSELTCKRGDSNESFKLDAAVAMIKGYGISPPPKAMGEDSFVLDTVVIALNGVEHQIPIMATMDGGGGHALAQFGQEKLKDEFEGQLNTLVQTKPLNADTIATAMELTDEALFGRRYDENGKITFEGKGHAYLKDSHESARSGLAKKLGLGEDTPLNVRDFILFFKNLKMNLLEDLKDDEASKNKLLNLNPIEIYNSKDIKDVDKILSFEHGDKKWEMDLSQKDVAEEVQTLYANAYSDPTAITMQLVMNTFYMTDGDELECVTFNRGDAIAYHATDQDDPENPGDPAERVLQALSLPEQTPLSGSTNTSAMVMKDGDNVFSCSDGIPETTNVKDIQKGLQEDSLKNLPAQEFVAKLVKASHANGSGDDQTAVNITVTRMPASQEIPSGDEGLAAKKED